MALRVVYWWQATPLRLDEASVALNLMVQPVGALFSPLEAFRVEPQVEPSGLLLLQKGLGALFGYGERVLRLPGLVAALAALPLFDRLADRLLEWRGRLTADVLFALCWWPFFFGVYVKHYGVELFFAVLLSWGALAWGTESRKYLAAAVGSLLFSFASIFVAAGAYLVALLRRRDRTLLVRAGVFAGAVAALYLLQLRPAARDPFLVGFWEEHMLAGARAPLTWSIRHLRYFLENPASMGNPAVAGGALLFGAWRLARERPASFWPVAACVPLVVAASALGKWPLALRLVLFLVPLAILCISVGLGRMAVPGPRGIAVAAAGAILLLPGTRNVLAYAFEGAGPRDFRAVARELARPEGASPGGWPILAHRYARPPLLYYFRRAGGGRTAELLGVGGEAREQIVGAAARGPFWLVTSGVAEAAEVEGLRHAAAAAAGEPVRRVEAGDAVAVLYGSRALDRSSDEPGRPPPVSPDRAPRTKRRHAGSSDRTPTQERPMSPRPDRSEWPARLRAPGLAARGVAALASLIALALPSAAPLAAQSSRTPAVRAMETVRPSSGTHRVELVEPLTPGEIAAVERRLAAEGHRPGEVDGRLDEAAREALRAFQREVDLRICGCVDVETVRALGLGLRVVLTRVEGTGEGGSGEETARSAASVEVVYPTTAAGPGPEPAGGAGVDRSEAGKGEAAGPGVEDVTRRRGRAGVGDVWGPTVLPIPVPVLVGPDGSPVPPDGSGGEAATAPAQEGRGARPAPFPRAPMPPIRPVRTPPD